MSEKDEEIAALTMSCVRELLSKRGLKKTLAALDDEAPRAPNTVSKRSELARLLGIEKLLVKNKEKGSPRTGMLEVMAGYFADKQRKAGSPDTSQMSTNSNDRRAVDAPEPAGRASRSRAGGSQSKSRTTYSKPSSDVPSGDSTFFGASRGRSGPVPVAQATASLDVEDFELEEMDAEASSGPRRSGGGGGGDFGATELEVLGSRSVSASELKAMHGLLFPGGGRSGWNDAWQVQGFQFCECPALPYGLVQPEGGPCGVVAPVQATLLKNVLATGRNPATVTQDERLDLLAQTLAEILWRAGSDTSATVVLPSRGAHFAHTFNARVDLIAFLTTKVKALQAPGGCVALVYSAILSRSIAKVRKDMDEPDRNLMGQHSYCAQELVNLLTTGAASSNVFDGKRDLGGDMLLRGITSRADVGLLSLFEHYRSIEVGDHLKTPQYPVWVCHAESHYSVIYGCSQNLVGPPGRTTFDLFYYDPLGRQDEEIRITVDPLGVGGGGDDDLISPIEHCIRTKWRDASIDWNGHCGIY